MRRLDVLADVGIAALRDARQVCHEPSTQLLKYELVRVEIYQESYRVRCPLFRLELEPRLVGEESDCVGEIVGKDVAGVRGCVGGRSAEKADLDERVEHARELAWTMSGGCEKCCELAR